MPRGEGQEMDLPSIQQEMWEEYLVWAEKATQTCMNRIKLFEIQTSRQLNCLKRQSVIFIPFHLHHGHSMVGNPLPLGQLPLRD